MSRTLRFWCRVLAIIASCSVASCGDPSPTAPGPARSVVEGTWVGVLADHMRGEAQLRLSVTGFEESARGTFTMTFRDGSHDLAGDVTISTIDRPRVELFFRAPAAPGCPAGQGLVLHARATLASADRITGNYMDLVACDVPRRGTLELARP